MTKDSLRTGRLMYTYKIFTPRTSTLRMSTPRMDIDILHPKLPCSVTVATCNNCLVSCVESDSWAPYQRLHVSMETNTQFLLTTLPRIVLFCSFRLSGTALLPACATGFLGLVLSRPATRRFQMWERLGHSFTSSTTEPSKYEKIQHPTSLFQNEPIRI